MPGPNFPGEALSLPCRTMRRSSMPPTLRSGGRIRWFWHNWHRFTRHQLQYRLLTSWHRVSNILCRPLLPAPCGPPLLSASYSTRAGFLVMQLQTFHAHVSRISAISAARTVTLSPFGLHAGFAGPYAYFCIYSDVGPPTEPLVSQPGSSISSFKENFPYQSLPSSGAS